MSRQIDEVNLIGASYNLVHLKRQYIPCISGTLKSFCLSLKYKIMMVNNHLVPKFFGFAPSSQDKLSYPDLESLTTNKFASKC